MGDRSSGMVSLSSLSYHRFLQRLDGWGYCFQAIAGATVATTKGIFGRHGGSMAVFRGAGQEDRARTCTSMTLLPPCVADQVADRVQR